MTTKITLNNCQTAAKNEILGFLYDPSEKEFCLTGGPGTGKSTLVTDILSSLDEVNETIRIMGGKNFINDIVFTAPTNKAAGVINGHTIYSKLGLSMFNDYKTGKVRINTKNATPIVDSLVIVDEAFMLDDLILDLINKYVVGSSKVLFVGDQDQLPPVGCTTMPLLDRNIPSYELQTQERFDPTSEAYTLISNIKKWIRTGDSNFNINFANNVIQMGDADLDKFILNSTDRDVILTFTNECAIAMNQHTRALKGISTEFFNEGDTVLSCSTLPVTSKQGRIMTDMPYTITNIGPEEEYLGAFKYRSCLLNGTRVDVISDPKAYANAVKECKQRKDWREYFTLKEEFADVRDAYAITTHKSQGSTYDNVVVNLNNYRKCRDPFMLPRLLYVAISRAKYNVYIYGSLN